MANSHDVEQAGSKFSQVLEAAAKLPGVRIDRNAYLRAALRRHCTDEQIERAIAETPAAAGISTEVLTEVANTSIRYETSKATGLSTLAGLPGGFAMLGTIPADLAQYVGHMLRIAQKLAYVYSWPNLFSETSTDEKMDEATEGMLVLFLGVMVGVQFAQGGVAKAATMIAAQVAKKLPQQALTKGTIYPIVKNVSGFLGIAMTKKLFAGGLAKAVPVVGAVISGGLTLSTFLPMSKRLQRHLASLELTKPGVRVRPRAATAQGADSTTVEHVEDLA